jgi:pimeloyl-ACP methyl ester carboxylesterase
MIVGLALALSLSVNTVLEAQEIWVLLHGVGGSGRDWRYVAPALAQQGQAVLRPSLPHRAGLFAWAENIVGFFEESGLLERADRSVLIVAHSFGGAVVLFFLKTAYELEHQNLARLEAQLDCGRLQGRAVGACQKIKAGWQALLSDPARAYKWVRAARKIKHVFLYHAALRGACGADLDLWGLGGDATASLQLLAQLSDFFYHPLEHISWEGQITVVNLYGEENICSRFAASLGTILCSVTSSSGSLPKPQGIASSSLTSVRILTLPSALPEGGSWLRL